MSTARFLFVNGVASLSYDVPPVSSFLESHPGAYTTTRTHNNAKSLLFWDRHLLRLTNSVQILLNSNPNLLFGPQFSRDSTTSFASLDWDSTIQRRVEDSMRSALPVAMRERNDGEELAVTTLIGGNYGLDVYVHIGMYVPMEFGAERNAAHLAVVGKRRELAEAKYSIWARLRKPLEKLRPASATELLLSDNGDRILEGCITNFFVVCQKDIGEAEGEDLDSGSLHSYELQTAPIHDGVLPGVIRQLVIEVCLNKGIAVREVSPSWSMREAWEEAFITSSLRLIQHVETIRAPNSWASLGSNSSEVLWVMKQFNEGPGIVTAAIQKGLMERAGLEGYPITLLSE